MTREDYLTEVIKYLDSIYDGNPIVDLDYSRTYHLKHGAYYIEFELQLYNDYEKLVKDIGTCNIYVNDYMVDITDEQEEILREAIERNFKFA